MTFQTTILNITGMTCGSCSRHVDHVLRHVPAVSDVRVDQRAGMAQITHTGDTTSDALIAAMVGAGYDASLAS